MSGALPIGVTDNLNFGNPHKPEIFWQLKEAVQGISEACRFFEVPVTGGNVSLYNQSPAGPVDPTPTIGMVGQIAEEKDITKMFFKDTGDAIVLLGNWGWELAGTSYAQELHKVKRGFPPGLDLAHERHLHHTVVHLIRSGWVKSAHDLSDGGLGLALAESCIAGPHPIGATVDLPDHQRLDVLLFNETQSRALLSVAPENLQTLLDTCAAKHLHAWQIGTVGGKELILRQHAPHGRRLAWKLSELEESWGTAIEKIMG